MDLVHRNMFPGIKEATFQGHGPEKAGFFNPKSGLSPKEGRAPCKPPELSPSTDWASTN